MMVNPLLNAGQYAEQFRQEGLVEVDNFLTDQAAHFLYQILDEGLQWQLSFLNGGAVQQIPLAQLEQMDERELAQLNRRIAVQADRGFQFRFLRAAILDASVANTAIDCGLQKRGVGNLAETLSRDLIKFYGELTCDSETSHVSMYASYYAPGSYLKTHDDQTLSGRRQAAYVLSLTRAWDFDWGGLLEFEEKETARVERVLVPAFNRLILFKVPKPHHVTLVRESAGSKRYALQGWLTG
jgi:Rps23 Pro-64 3,4-dihydroxylase Tpa1-like proline 4-hydroxylase